MRTVSRNLIALFLVLALVLFVAKLPEGQAQSPAPARIAETQTFLSDLQPKPKTDLKDYFDKELRSMKSRSLSAADLKSIEKNSQTPKPGSHFSNKQKMFLAVWIVCMTAIVIALIKHPCKEKQPGDCEFIDNTDTY